MSSFCCWHAGSAHVCDVTAGRLRHRGVFPPLFAGVRRRGGGRGGLGRAGRREPARLAASMGAGALAIRVSRAESGRAGKGGKRRRVHLGRGRERAAWALPAAPRP